MFWARLAPKSALRNALNKACSEECPEQCSGQGLQDNALKNALNSPPRKSSPNRCWANAPPASEACVAERALCKQEGDVFVGSATSKKCCPPRGPLRSASSPQPPSALAPRSESHAKCRVEANNNRWTKHATLRNPAVIHVFFTKWIHREATELKMQL